MSRGLPLLLVAAGGVTLAVSLFLPWARPGDFIVFFGDVERLDLQLSGWELWDWADAVLLALAAGLVGLALPGRPPRALLAVALVLVAAAIAVVIGHGFDDQEVSAPGAAATVTRSAEGPWVALAALAAAALGLLLALRRRGRPAAPAG
jgi:hypothetical protein